jgi:osmotically-inducible protein OsmY
MQKDLELQQAANEQLTGSPDLHGTEIGISVKEGIVTKNDTAQSHTPDVCAIAGETVLDLSGSADRSDEEIVQAAIASLKALSCVPHKQIKLLVRNGFITMQGEIQNFYQALDIECALLGLMGVRGISNQLKVNSPVPVTVVEEEIERALERLEQMDAKRVSIQVTGNRVMLRGEVKTWREHEAAAQAAASIAGVKDVKNEIRVAPWMF